MYSTLEGYVGVCCVLLAFLPSFFELSAVTDSVVTYQGWPEETTGPVT